MTPPVSIRVIKYLKWLILKHYTSSESSAHALLINTQKKYGWLGSQITSPVSNRVKRVFWSEMKGVAKIKRYCHLGMAKIILFYSGVMALILPWFKEITNFVLKLICSSFIFKCLRDDLYSSVIYQWNCQLKPYWFSVRKIGLIRVTNCLPCQ